MDPVTVPTLAAAISALVGGAAGEAGKTAWNSLTSLVRRTFGVDDRSESEAVAALEAVEREPTDQGSAEALAGALVDRADTDPEFAEVLHSWAGRAAQVVGGSHNVSNVVSGQVEGPVIQARDVSGSINIGDTRSS